MSLVRKIVLIAVRVVNNPEEQASPITHSWGHWHGDAHNQHSPSLAPYVWGRDTTLNLLRLILGVVGRYIVEQYDQ